LRYRSLGRVVARLPEKVSLTSSTVSARAGQPGDAISLKPFLDVDWAKAVDKGDARRGRKLYVSLNCAKCHAITDDSPVSGGPSLAQARRRFTVPYVVESVLTPSMQISPVF